MNKGKKATSQKAKLPPVPSPELVAAMNKYIARVVEYNRRAKYKAPVKRVYFKHHVDGRQMVKVPLSGAGKGKHATLEWDCDVAMLLLGWRPNFSGNDNQGDGVLQVRSRFQGGADGPKSIGHAMLWLSSNRRFVPIDGDTLNLDRNNRAHGSRRQTTIAIRRAAKASKMGRKGSPTSQQAAPKKAGAKLASGKVKK